ncbi:MAG: hypothetical protein HY744_14525 [Deltaproteobacteria bacterium]|nr:hypothetical protein [Deltaproteobacteria bacterium]
MSSATGRVVLGRVAERRGKLRGLPGQAGPQLERALVGAHTNLCAAAASQGADAKRQFRSAASEAAETGGCLDAAVLFGALGQSEQDEWRELLRRLWGCLRRLAR